MTAPTSMATIVRMTVTINGERRILGDQTLAELLASLDLHERRCATMVNGEIVKRVDRAGRLLRDGDEVEIISMV
ncbi:MAG TPA: sulfur carrier protein ThiS, partial [Candidatus Sumerlaeota bacterium]|nr:sulfur carrier protein ThiS [Candidatus Sumerlaeota bacterium]